MKSELSIQKINFKDISNIQVDHWSNTLHTTSIIFLPAIGVPVAKYEKLFQHLFGIGYNLIYADYPGCGRNTPTVSRHFDYGYADLIDEFIPQLHKIAKGNAAKKIILFGHSLGGHLATLYAQHHRIITIGIATGNIGLRYWDLKGKINILKAATVFNVMILKDGFLAGYKVGFGNKEAKSLMRDWSKTIFTGNYKHISGKNESVSSNQALFIQLKNDHFAPLPSTLGLSKYFTNPDIITLDLTSDIQGNQHSAWIKQPELIVTTIKNWLQKH
ncbi:alpha/beta fold hydrolase [Acinetobacter stercoris]|uniref:Alpha/beta hydrolase family protein n=1 Tax=Acinetobacter stercoris TaxID=2126983 RepID=A0A2U3MW23_9GAMM|nr:MULTISPECIES: alpha/beta fold hydrolase [Acinetobacter]SPL69584.1 Alpha/beta hydrolase family protein [Acinetobacter stercoris]